MGAPAVRLSPCCLPGPRPPMPPHHCCPPWGCQNGAGSRASCPRAQHPAATILQRGSSSIVYLRCTCVYEWSCLSGAGVGHYAQRRNTQQPQL
eukprot:531377-Pelagomonas_calceolata.AAC.4